MMSTIPLQIVLALFCGADESPAQTALSSQRRVTSLAFGPNNQTIFAACWIRVGRWNAVTGRHQKWFRHTVPYQYMSISDFAVFPDGNRLIVAGNNSKITFWNLATGSKTRTIYEPWFFDHNLHRRLRITKDDVRFKLVAAVPDTSVGFSTMSLSNDGKLLAAGLKDGTIHIWQTQTGKHVGEMGSSLARKREVKLDDIFGDKQMRERWGTALGKTSAAGDEQTAVESIVLWTLPQTKRCSVYSVEFDPRGENLFVTDRSGLRVWNVETKKAKTINRHCSSFAVSPDGNIIVAFNSEDRNTYVFNAKTGSQIRRLTDNRKANGVLMFSQDGKRLATAGTDQRVRVWNTTTGKLFREFSSQQPDDSLRALAISPNGKTLAAYWQDAGGIRIWNLADGMERAFGTSK